MAGTPSWVGMPEFHPTSLSKEVQSPGQPDGRSSHLEGLIPRTLNATLYFGRPVISPKGADVAVKQIRCLTCPENRQTTIRWQSS
jgi:hypothetical protein